MKKFNWDEFKNKDNEIAVHCKTEEEAKDFCRQMHGQGMKWRNGGSYLKNTNYDMFNERTCYYGDGEYSSLDFAENHNYKILEWSDCMNKEFTKADLEDGMVVKYRDGSKRMVIKDYFIGVDGYLEQRSIQEDLTHRNLKGLDIVCVYETKDYGRFEDMLSDNNLIAIWERKEPKKMTVEEMRKKLEELTGEQIEVTA